MTRTGPRPGTAAESLADLIWFVVLTFGYVATWRLSGSTVDSSVWVSALTVSNTSIYVGRYYRRRRLEEDQARLRPK